MLPAEKGEAEGTVKILTIPRQANDGWAAGLSRGARKAGNRILLISEEIGRIPRISSIPRLIGDFPGRNGGEMVPLLLHD